MVSVGTCSSKNAKEESLVLGLMDASDEPQPAGSGMFCEAARGCTLGPT